MVDDSVYMRALDWTPQHLNPATLEVRFLGYTPYMGGDFQAQHYVMLKNGGYYLSGYPTAKALLGKMRWLARVTIATALGLRSHKEAETLPSALVRVKVGKNIEKRKIGLIPLLFGATSAHHTINWAIRGLVNLAVTPLDSLVDNAHPLLKEYPSFVDEDYLVAGSLVARRKKKRGTVLEPAPTRFRLMIPSRELSQPREHVDVGYLVLDEKLRGLVPVKADWVSFKARLVFDHARASRLLEDYPELPDKLAEFAAALLLAVPLLLGIGKGGTRGFGRFTPEIKECPALFSSSASRKLCSSIANLLRGVESEKNLKTVIESLHELARELASITGQELAGEEDITLVSKIPRLPDSPDSVLVLEPRYKWKRAKPVNQALAAIGEASLRNTWKRLTPRKGRQNRSVRYNHSWPLGLPRSRKPPGKCQCCGGELSPRENPLKTGYLLMRPREGGPFRVAPARCKCLLGNDTIPWEEAFVSDGRRQSMIVAFPLPALREVAVLLFPAYDLLDYIVHGSKRLHRAATIRGEKNCVEQVESVYAEAQSAGLDLSKPSDFLKAVKSAYGFFVKSLEG